MDRSQSEMFAARMRAARDRLMLTQEELAAALGQRQQAVQRWEAGGAEPSARTVVAVARALNVTTDYLLGESDDTGDDIEEGALSPVERKLLWLMQRGLTLEAITLIVGLNQPPDDRGNATP